MLRRSKKQPGFSLIESVVATVLVSITLVASLNTMAFVVKTTNYKAETQNASQFAQTLLSEIASRPFKDPVNGTTAIGTEADESSATRAQWDDCDDYHNWSTTAITILDGTPLAGATGWRAGVSVSYCSPTDPALASATPSALKKISLTLGSPSGKTFTFHSLRCDAGPLLIPQTTATTVLSSVDVSMQSGGKSQAVGARLHNQQVPN